MYKIKRDIPEDGIMKDLREEEKTFLLEYLQKFGYKILCTSLGNYKNIIWYKDRNILCCNSSSVNTLREFKNFFEEVISLEPLIYN